MGGGGDPPPVQSTLQKPGINRVKERGVISMMWRTRNMQRTRYNEEEASYYYYYKYETD